ncbi:MAG: CapA family protein, partial [Lachnospiraceae bacterium]|nr:CapA family protein [Lachnospiraceae bacterium]
SSETDAAADDTGIIQTDADDEQMTEKSDFGKSQNSDELSSSEPSTPATLVFTGDICFHDPFANMGAYRQRGSNIDNCIDDELLSQMRDADICMVNNEFPYSDRGAPLEGKTYAFRSKPSNVSILSDMGVDIAGIANNHAFDHGETAFLDTLDTLADEGIAYVGGGRNIEEAAAPVIIEKGGMKIGFVAATQIERNWSPDTRGATKTQPGVMRTFTEEELAGFLEAVQNADALCDFLVVFVHWGSENTDILDWRQTDQAAAYAKAGADLIVGAHPHCLQGLGLCGEVPVVYSLGNYWFNSKRVDTALLKVVVEEGRLRSLQMIPALQHDCRTDHVEGAEAERIIGYLNSISRDGAHLDAEGFLERAGYENSEPIN